jgi:hypothetical protein
VGLEQVTGLGSAPETDELELSLLGPGWGECVLVHLGGGVWITIDSCVDNSSAEYRSLALSYLNQIGVAADQSVMLVLCTHWHDNHIGGLAQIVDHCQQADFFLSSALQDEQFAAMVRAYQKGALVAGGSGVTEIDRIFDCLRRSRRPAGLAIQDRRIFRLDGEDSGHGLECLVWSLSLSDAQVARFLAGLSFPSAGQTKARCHPMRPNHQTVVVWIEIGETKILLGGDLEETEEQRTGWSVIVRSPTRPSGQASILKIPHHGSQNGHSDCVWRKMLVQEPFALLTPWNRGSKLPTPDDVTRIVGLTPNAYSTATLAARRVKRRSPPVEKTLRELGVNVRPSEPRTGLLRMRKRRPGSWRLECFNGACHLSEVHSQPDRISR